MRYDPRHKEPQVKVAAKADAQTLSVTSIVLLVSVVVLLISGAMSGI